MLCGPDPYGATGRPSCGMMAGQRRWEQKCRQRGRRHRRHRQRRFCGKMGKGWRPWGRRTGAGEIQREPDRPGTSGWGELADPTRKDGTPHPAQPRSLKNCHLCGVCWESCKYKTCMSLPPQRWRPPSLGCSKQPGGIDTRTCNQAATGRLPPQKSRHH